MGNNAVAWWEHRVGDLQSAQKFYGEVFGWKFTSFGEDYVVINGPESEMPIGALIKDKKEGARLFAGVEDLEATLAATVAAGGKVVTERTLISDEFGWYAMIQDADGHEFGLCTMAPPKS